MSADQSTRARPRCRSPGRLRRYSRRATAPGDSAAPGVRPAPSVPRSPRRAANGSAVTPAVRRRRQLMQGRVVDASARPRERYMKLDRAVGLDTGLRRAIPRPGRDDRALDDGDVAGLVADVD